MGKPNKLKTAKISIASEDMSSDGYYGKKHVRKAQRKERQKGKKVIKDTMNECGCAGTKNFTKELK